MLKVITVRKAEKYGESVTLKIKSTNPFQKSPLKKNKGIVFSISGYLGDGLHLATDSISTIVYDDKNNFVAMAPSTVIHKQDLFYYIGYTIAKGYQTMDNILKIMDLKMFIQDKSFGERLTKGYINEIRNQNENMPAGQSRQLLVFKAKKDMEKIYKGLDLIHKQIVEMGHLTEQGQLSRKSVMGDE